MVAAAVERAAEAMYESVGDAVGQGEEALAMTLTGTTGEGRH